MANGEHTFTPAGNQRGPTKILMANWVKQAWEELDPGIIRKSFKVCLLFGSFIKICVS